MRTYCFQSAGICIATAGLLIVGLAGCQTDGGPPSAAIFPAAAESPAVTQTFQDPETVEYYPSDEPLRLGLEHFGRGHYGLAEHYFRDAVEKNPRDATAWVGLAACYDQIRRFDLADRSYAEAIKLIGQSTQIINNLGYSYMLRGDYVAARKKYLQALKREPQNPTIINNLALLDSSRKATGRLPGE
jgi:Flp pilus assembly protein TadD